MKNIRNFCIIAHIDHGKSTLADRLIEVTGTRTKREMKDRVMDTLEIEQERGITIKLQTARMIYHYDPTRTMEKLGVEPTEENRQGLELPEAGEYILNLIDTPGHVDFGYEVSRSVAASEIALLLVDSTQGIQAQTLSTMYKAVDYELKVIPVINKIDLPSANVERTRAEIRETFGFKDEEMVLASGKSGIGVNDLLDKIVEVGPAPGDASLISPMMTVADAKQVIGGQEVTKALIYDSFYHEFKGVVALVKVVSGAIRKNDKLFIIGTKSKVEPVEIGYLRPDMYVSDVIAAGEVGYIGTGLKDIHQVHVGDTVTLNYSDEINSQIDQLPGYQPPKQMVFASLYPVEASDFPQFQESLEKLGLNDAALTYERENSPALGSGFVCGFLGLLHLEVTMERLEREFDLDLISTTPTVEFELKLTTSDYSKVPNMRMSNLREDGVYLIRTASEYPGGSLVSEIREPWFKVEILCPDEYVGSVMELCKKNRGVYIGMSYVAKNQTGQKHAVLNYELPAAEIIVSFFDKLKSVTHGYASMDYEFLEYRQGDVIKLSIMVNNEEIEALSVMVHREFAERRGREMVDKLKDIIPRQNFTVPIQAAINAKIIARETIQAYRKDVTAKLYGGDITRKKKLLEKQKKGKKRLKMFGKVEIPKEAFLAALKT
jgi:GTP-binding protein LepA